MFFSKHMISLWKSSALENWLTSMGHSVSAVSFHWNSGQFTRLVHDLKLAVTLNCIRGVDTEKRRMGRFRPLCALRSKFRHSNLTPPTSQKANQSYRAVRITFALSSLKCIKRGSLKKHVHFFDNRTSANNFLPWIVSLT